MENRSYNYIVEKFKEHEELKLEWVKPLYCDVTQVNTEIGGENIKTYEVTIEEKKED